jgi:hypothetical protein
VSNIEGIRAEFQKVLVGIEETTRKLQFDWTQTISTVSISNNDDD